MRGHGEYRQLRAGPVPFRELDEGTCDGARREAGAVRTLKGKGSRDESEKVRWEGAQQPGACRHACHNTCLPATTSGHR